MDRRILVRCHDIAVVCVLAALVVPAVVKRPAASESDTFARDIDLEPLGNIAVHDVGRIKSFDSFARATVRSIAGPRGIPDQSPVFSYLDLMFNSDKYADEDIIYVKRAIRPQMRQVLEQLNIDEQRINTFVKTGMISESLVRAPQMIEELKRLDADVIRTAKFVSLIEGALFYLDPRQLSGRLKIIPPPGGDDQAAWYSGQDLWGLGAALGTQADAAEAGGIPGMPEVLAAQLRSGWKDLGAAWHERNAEAASTAIASLAENLAKINPSLYPDLDKLSLESWYFRFGAFVWNWIIYILAAVPLLLSVIYRWRAAYRIGIVTLLLAFAVHTGSLGIRWYLAGRIPNSNMFEAILASTWFGVVGAIILELLVRKTAMRGLFFLGASTCAMVAMMCQHFMPTTLRSDIDNVMPVLNDLWLYIHTNVIIWSYCLIGMAAISAWIYLRYRLGGGDPKVAKAGGAGSLILDGAGGKGDSFLRGDRATAGQVLDAATMVTMELSFIMLWSGLVMGAIWADHSWGRPWGWDPKEVFALCTFVIFLILVHVRFKVRDKGLWTAVLALVGCGVMLFNWIVINFKIQGLHSYA